MTNLDIKKQLGSLHLPLIVAPMFLISSPELVIQACHAGVVGSFPSPNVRSSEELESWLDKITQSLARLAEGGSNVAPWAVNLVVHTSNKRLPDDLAVVQRYKAPIVITALGSPGRVLAEVKSYGGLVFADVNTIEYARKAAALGVDGLILVCNGAGGHTGMLSNFAFVSEVRRFWDGYLVVAGGISHGRDIRAVETMGADFAYMGTSFIATEESLAEQAYKEMVVECSASDLLPSRAFTGVLANWMRPSILKKGLDPDEVAKQAGKINFSGQKDAEKKAWKGIWSAGQGVGNVTAICRTADLVKRLKKEYDESLMGAKSHQ